MSILSQIARSVFPGYIWAGIRFEWPMTKLRWRNRFLPSRRQKASHLRQMTDVKLHLGCGTRIFPDWLNLDCFPAEGIFFESDFRDPLPFSDNSVRLLYSEHVLEHFREEDALSLLGECHRVMAPNSTLRLGVPDAEVYIRAYVNRDNEFFENAKGIGNPCRPLDTPMKIFNQMARMGGHHHFAWDFETLKNALEQAGFCQVVRQVSGSSEHPELLLDDPAHSFETLYVEAKKA